jgi:hypothetical protein
MLCFEKSWQNSRIGLVIGGNELRTSTAPGVGIEISLWGWKIGPTGFYNKKNWSFFGTQFNF